MGVEEYRGEKIWDWRNMGSSEDEREFGMEVLSFVEKNVPVVCSTAVKGINLYKRLPAPVDQLHQQINCTSRSTAPAIVNTYNFFTAFTDRSALKLTRK
jgi:hypothetical protein